MSRQIFRPRAARANAAAVRSNPTKRFISLSIFCLAAVCAADVMEECRKRAAETFAEGRPVSKGAAAVVILVCIVASLPVIGL